MVPNHLLHVDIFFTSTYYGTPSCQSPRYFFYIGTKIVITAAHNLYIRISSSSYSIFSHVLKMLPSTIFLCRGFRCYLYNLPLKILSCLRSSSHQIKTTFTYRDRNYAIVLYIIQLFEPSVTRDSTSLPNPIYDLRLVNQ